jgi:hypothetical protein
MAARTSSSKHPGPGWRGSAAKDADQDGEEAELSKPTTDGSGPARIDNRNGSVSFGCTLTTSGAGPGWLLVAALTKARDYIAGTMNTSDARLSRRPTKRSASCAVARGYWPGGAISASSRSCLWRMPFTQGLQPRHFVATYALLLGRRQAPQRPVECGIGWAGSLEAESADGRNHFTVPGEIILPLVLLITLGSLQET